MSQGYMPKSTKGSRHPQQSHNTVSQAPCYHLRYPSNCSLYVDSSLAALHTAAQERRQQAVRPGTRKNLKACQTLFLQFCIHYCISVNHPTVDDVGAFTELLLEAGRLVPTVKNYCTAIKSLYIHWDNQVVVSAFDSPTWRMMLRGISLSVGPTADRRTAVEMEVLKAMIRICDTDKSLLPLKVALLFGYFGYLRISNMAPPTMDQFDAGRHTSWADVTPSNHGIMVALKWTKSLQTQKGSLRRGGATYSFTKGVPLLFIKQPGTWKSAAVEDYLIKTPLFSTPVTQTFVKTLANNYK